MEWKRILLWRDFFIWEWFGRDLPRPLVIKKLYFVTLKQVSARVIIFLEIKKRKNVEGLDMKKFDMDYKLLEEMYEDGYFPDFLVDKIKVLVQSVIDFLETGERNLEKIQEKFDEMTLAINDLQEEFEENDSEIETVARDCIGETVGYILQWFDINIDVEDAIGERDW